MFEVHPGAVLRDELEARGMSANALAIALKVNAGRVTEILNENRGISPDTALRLGTFFGNEAQFWLNLQSAHDLAVAKRKLGARIRDEVRPASSAA